LVGKLLSIGAVAFISLLFLSVWPYEDVLIEAFGAIALTVHNVPSSNGRLERSCDFTSLDGWKSASDGHFKKDFSTE